MYSRYGHMQQSRGRMPKRVLLVVAAILALLIAAVAIVRTVYYQRLKPVSTSQTVQLVTIKSGTTSNEISQLLADKQLIQSPTIFQWYIRTKDVRDKMKAGTYALRPSMSVPQIVDILVNGSVKSDLVTILPGQRLDQVRETMINAGFKPDAVDKALDPAQYAGHPALADKPVSASLEGFIYPESYQVDANTEPGLIIKEALDQMAKRLTPDIRAKFAAHGLTVYEGVTLASIVGQEVSNPSDRAQAAQVFLKRHDTGMMLGSDVTAFYGAIVAGKTPSVDYDSPYNTRIHKGWPVGPISNVSEGSLQAAASPADTDWLYFVAGDDGTTHFSKTLDEHEALTERYCHKLCMGT